MTPNSHTYQCDISPGRYRLLSVIVPVYNEQTTVAEALRRVREVTLPLDVEIIVIDDGSTDATPDILAALDDPTVRVITHAQNRGKGAAFRTGLAASRGDLIVIHDADLEYDPRDWPNMLNPVLNGIARVVYGSRFAGTIDNMHPLHLAGNRLLTRIANFLYGSNLSDLETCYKLFDRASLDQLYLRSDGFEIDPELTAKVLRLGIPIHEVPISYAGRRFRDGKKISWRDGFQVLKTLARYRTTAPKYWTRSPNLVESSQSVVASHTDP